MADSFVQVPADGAGKRLDTRTAPDGDHREVVVVGSPTLVDVAEADAANGLDVDVTRSALPTGAATAALQLPNSHDVTVDNAAGAAAVNVQDGGNSLTVDGTVAVTGVATAANQTTELASLAAIESDVDAIRVAAEIVDNAIAGSEMQVDVVAALPAGTNNIGDVDVLTLPALVAGSANIGDVDVASIAAGDNNIGNVDIVTLPALVAGSANIGDVDIASVAAGTVMEVVGDVASDAAVPTNPVVIGARASTAQPTPVSADGDSVNIWANRKGAPIVSMVPHIGLIGDPWTLTGETAQYTTTQTSAVLVAGGASERLVVTKVQIQAGGTTAGTLQLYFGTGAYSRGTNLAIFDGEFAPSATLKPGIFMDGPFISAANGDDLLVTTSAAINPLTITVWYYLLT